MLRDTIPGRRGGSGNFTQDSNGILLFYDNSRTRWISVTRQFVSFGLKNRNISDSRWMQVTGDAYSLNTGYRLPRNAILTSLTVQTQNNVSNCAFRLRRNGVASNIASLTLVGQDANTLDNLNVDLDAGDWLQVYLEITSGNVDHPELLLELAWR